jgi:hypothetical protein
MLTLYLLAPVYALARQSMGRLEKVSGVVSALEGLGIFALTSAGWAHCRDANPRVYNYYMTTTLYGISLNFVVYPLGLWFHANKLQRILAATQDHMDSAASARKRPCC